MFFLDEGGRLIRFSEQAYDSEDLLQSILASNPDLLAGEQMSPTTPRRWLLVRREAGVADRDGGGDRWAVDHLFLDQDGVPTLVEVKRSSDSRIRREVVGQMLDYAANAIVYMPAEQIRSRFESRCEIEGLDVAHVLESFVGDDGDVEAYWERVRANLDAGHVRLVFVADVIPAELRRIVEYLNGQMSPTEVYAVEIPQYVGVRDGHAIRALTPRLIGRTAEAGRAKSADRTPAAPWDWARFSTDLRARAGEEAVARAAMVRDWVDWSGLRLWWGRGIQRGGFVAILDLPDGSRHQLFELWSDGNFEVYFQHLAAKGPFVDESLRRELYSRLVAIGRLQLPEGSIGRRPQFNLMDLSDRRAVDDVVGTFAWVCSVIKEGAR